MCCSYVEIKKKVTRSFMFYTFETYMCNICVSSIYMCGSSIFRPTLVGAFKASCWKKMLLKFFSLFFSYNTACSCNTLGSVDASCQNMTGQCNCRPNVIGRICDDCAENTFDFRSGEGCKLCQCHPQGSKSQQCNLVSSGCQLKSTLSRRIYLFK